MLIREAKKSRFAQGGRMSPDLPPKRLRRSKIKTLLDSEPDFPWYPSRKDKQQ